MFKISLLSIVILSLVALILFVKPYKIMTQSMQEVIKPGDVVLTIKKYHRKSYKKGDIIAFQKGGDRTTFIKRVYAVAGDTLKVFRNYILIGGQKTPHDSIFEMMVSESEHPDSSDFFSSKDYRMHLLKSSGLPIDIINEKEIFSKEESMIVPENHYFMVGDNYYESMDSRFWGFIPKKNIKGKVIWIF